MSGRAFHVASFDQDTSLITISIVIWIPVFIKIPIAAPPPTLKLPARYSVILQGTSVVLHVPLITNYLSPCIPDYTQSRESFVQEYIPPHVPRAYTGVHGVCFFCTFAAVAGSATVIRIL